jgi:hypothetical protein
MLLFFMASLKFKLKTYVIGSKSSHINACTFMEYALSSYAHITPNVTHTLNQIQAKILCPNIHFIYSMFFNIMMYC